MTGFNKQRTTNGDNQVANNITYLLIGGGIGAALALLFAPKSGSELRHDISEITLKGYDETLEFARHLKEQSSDLYAALIEKKDEVYDFAAAKLARAENAVDEGIKTAADTTKKALHNAADAVETGTTRTRKNISNAF